MAEKIVNIVVRKYKVKPLSGGAKEFRIPSAITSPNGKVIAMNMTLRQYFWTIDFRWTYNIRSNNLFFADSLE